MSKRFKALEAALGYLRSPTADADDVTPDAPANSQLARYQQYAAGKRAITYVRAGTSKPEQLDELLLKPFALAAADTDKTIVPVSKRAFDKLTTVGLTVADLNVSTTLTDGRKERGFQPARAIISVGGTGDGQPENSKITGKKYTKKDVSTYTLPFGQGEVAGEVSYASIAADIINKVAAGTTNRSVTFKAEVYR